MILRMLTIMLNYEPITNVHPPPQAISPPLLSGPTRLYQAVSSSSSMLSSSTIAVVVCHHRYRCHHGVGCCFVPSAATVILILVIQRRHNPTNEGITTASPPFSSPHAILPLPVAFPPSPPSRSPMAPSWTGMQRQRPLVRRGECRSRPCPPCRKTGQLCQRRRHGRRDASVSSPAARVRPSFIYRAAATGWATATAAC